MEQHHALSMTFERRARLQLPLSRAIFQLASANRAGMPGERAPLPPLESHATRPRRSLASLRSLQAYSYREPLPTPGRSVEVRTAHPYAREPNLHKAGSRFHEHNLLEALLAKGVARDTGNVPRGDEMSAGTIVVSNSQRVAPHLPS